MPTVITIDLVTTEDAQPTVAPHRVSADPAHDDVEVRFTATNDGGLLPGEMIPWEEPLPENRRPPLRIGPGVRPGAIEPIFPSDTLYPDIDALVPGMLRDSIAWVMNVGGVSPDTGKRVTDGFHNRCSSAFACSTTRAATRRRPPNRLKSGVQRIVTTTYAAISDGSGDSTVTLKVWIYTPGQGWS